MLAEFFIEDFNYSPKYIMCLKRLLMKIIKLRWGMFQEACSMQLQNKKFL